MRTAGKRHERRSRQHTCRTDATQPPHVCTSVITSTGGFAHAESTMRSMETGFWRKPSPLAHSMHLRTAGPHARRQHHQGGIGRVQENCKASGPLRLVDLVCPHPGARRAPRRESGCALLPLPRLPNAAATGASRPCNVPWAQTGQGPISARRRSNKFVMTAIRRFVVARCVHRRVRV